MITLYDIKWAAEECERQKSGELSVSYLCNALKYAKELKMVGAIIDVEEILILGKLVEPEKNKGGFRTTPVYFNDDQTQQALSWEIIPRAIDSLLHHGKTLSPTEWYEEFESIHPFSDGNGRVGAILFNIRNGTIDLPVTPPKVF